MGDEDTKKAIDLVFQCNDFFAGAIDLFLRIDITDEALDYFTSKMAQKHLNRVLYNCSIGFMMGGRINKFIDDGFHIDDEALFEVIKQEDCYYYFDKILGYQNMNMTRKLKLTATVNTIKYLIDKGFVFDENFQQIFSFCPTITKLFGTSFTKKIIHRLNHFMLSDRIMIEHDNKLYLICFTDYLCGQRLSWGFPIRIFVITCFVAFCQYSFTFLLQLGCEKQ